MAFQPQSLFQPEPLQSYGYCDSYFVENHDDDDGIFARAAADRERQRQMAKVTQKHLGEELSHATAEEYQDDILRHMEHMEVSGIQYSYALLYLMQCSTRRCQIWLRSRFRPRFNGS